MIYTELRWVERHAKDVQRPHRVLQYRHVDQGEDESDDDYPSPWQDVPYVKPEDE